MTSFLVRRSILAALAVCGAAACGGATSTGGAGGTTHTGTGATGTGATGTGTTGTGATSTSSSTHTAIPATPDTAWVVNLTGGGQNCNLPSSSQGMGMVEAMLIQVRILDQQAVAGQGTATVSCSVTTAGAAFSVNAQARLGADSIQIDIPSLAPGATSLNPATGSISYESAATVTVYEGTGCHFYFASASEGVDAGKVWVAFTCDAIIDGSSIPPASC